MDDPGSENNNPRKNQGVDGGSFPFSRTQRNAIRWLLSQFRRGIVSESASNLHQCAIHVCFFQKTPDHSAGSVSSEGAALGTADEQLPDLNLEDDFKHENNPETALLPDKRIADIQRSFQRFDVKLRWVCASLALVCAQCFTMAVIFWSTLNPSCALNDTSAGCPTGHFCRRRTAYADAGWCAPCSDKYATFCANLKQHYPSYDSMHAIQPGRNSSSIDGITQFNEADIDFETWGFPEPGSAMEASASRHEVVEVICPQCYAPFVKFSSSLSGNTKIGRTAEYRFTDAGTANLERVQQLRRGDAIVVIVCSVLIALAVCREIRDIQLCEWKQKCFFSELRRSERVEVDHSGRGRDYRGRFVFAFNFAQALRTFVLIPFLAMTSSVLVVFRGREAVAVCMNTVAILIVLDMDNYAYDFGLSEELRAYFDCHDRMIISPRVGCKLDRVKNIHLVLLPGSICWGVFCHLIPNGYIGFIGGLLGSCMMTTPMGFTVERVLRKFYSVERQNETKISATSAEKKILPATKTFGRGGDLPGGDVEAMDAGVGAVDLPSSCCAMVCDIAKIWAKGLAGLLFLVFMAFWSHDENS